MVIKASPRSKAKPAFGKSSLVAVLVFAGVFGPLRLAAADKNCDASSTGLVPINDLGPDLYLGHQGGLYPNGSNEVPSAHLEGRLAQGGAVVPRNAAGEPAADGLVGLLAIGVSNTLTEFSSFERVATNSGSMSPSVALVNGAQGSRPLEDWVGERAGRVWQGVDDALAQQRVDALQVQVAWIKLPTASRGTVDLGSAEQEIRLLVDLIQELKTKFPNLGVGYLSSRIYAGYALRPDSSRRSNSPEPTAYQHGFTVKWLIQRQIDGDDGLNYDPDRGPVRAPWIGWGPYLWADGPNPRTDGLTWDCVDLGDDGIHPSPSGADKVAQLLLEHFSRESTAIGWFTGSGPPLSSTVADSTTPLNTITASTEESSPNSSGTAATGQRPVESPPPNSGMAVAGLVLVGVIGLALWLLWWRYQRR